MDSVAYYIIIFFMPLFL